MSVSLKFRISAELPAGVRKCRMPLSAENNVLYILWEASITVMVPHAQPTVLWGPDVCDTVIMDVSHRRDQSVEVRMVVY